PGDPAGLAREASRVGDWREILRRAHRHGVAPVLAHELAAAGVALPDAVARDEALRRTAERVWQGRARAVLDEALAAAEGAGVRAVPLKGPVLAERLYP